MDSVFIALIFSGCSIFLIIFRELFLWLRTKVPRTVQCWFCHNKTKVEFSISNSWFCSNCDQYNGFTKDGDYNRIIDGQHEEKLNITVTSSGRSKSSWKSTNRLCDKCNHNQELKVQQLASFIPLNEKNYDLEIEHYRIQLEKSYKLCSNCECLMSKIFSNERKLFSLPRRLAIDSIIKPEVTGIGRIILYMNLLVSLLISMTAYINLEGVPPIVKTYLNESNNSTITLWIIHKSFYLLPTGLLLNIFAWINTFSTGLLLNSTSWFIILLLNTYPNGYKHYIIALQAISGIVSCGVSVVCLTSNQKKLKEKSKFSAFDRKKFSFGHSSARDISNSETFTNCATEFQENNASHINHNVGKVNSHSSKSPPPSPRRSPKSVPIVKHQRNLTDAINSGIRGLNLGSTNNETKNVTKRNNYGYSSSTSSVISPWWLNSGIRQRNSRGRTSQPQRTTAGVQHQQHSIYNSTLRPPSTPSSGFSDDLDDIVDDTASCTGHSPICKHYPCNVTPPSVQYAYYYAAAHFQRLLYSTPSPPSPQHLLPSSTINTNLPPVSNSSIISTSFSYLLTMSLIILCVSNLAVLWTIYTKNLLKN